MKLGSSEHRGQLSRWLAALEQCAMIAVAATIIALAPLPLVQEWLPIKNVILAAGTVTLIGKTLYDTLFEIG